MAGEPEHGTVNRVLVVGAQGFVGSRLTAVLAADPAWSVRASVRGRRPGFMPDRVEVVEGGELAAGTDWAAALAGVDRVVHCAARAHLLRDAADDPLAQFRLVNVEGTLALARQAQAAGVRRFVFVSTIGVNGDRTRGRPFSAEDPPAPHSPYARSKWEAERALQALVRGGGMELVVVRPPLVYGPGAPGNFGLLVRWLRRGRPLPLGSVRNRRSFVALDNLVDFLCACLLHPAAAGATFLVSDGHDLSTTDFVRALGAALGSRSAILPFPPLLMQAAAGVLGRSQQARGLLGSLQVDCAPAQARLGWRPPLGFEAAIRRAAQDGTPTAACSARSGPVSGA